MFTDNTQACSVAAAADASADVAFAVWHALAFTNFICRAQKGCHDVQYSIALTDGLKGKILYIHLPPALFVAIAPAHTTAMIMATNIPAWHLSCMGMTCLAEHLQPFGLELAVVAAVVSCMQSVKQFACA